MSATVEPEAARTIQDPEGRVPGDPTRLDAIAALFGSMLHTRLEAVQFAWRLEQERWIEVLRWRLTSAVAFVLALVAGLLLIAVSVPAGARIEVLAGITLAFALLWLVSRTAARRLQRTAPEARARLLTALRDDYRAVAGVAEKYLADHAER